MKRKGSSFLVALLLLAAACIPELVKPDVRLAGVRLAGLGLSGGLLYVRLSVVNPNRFDLEADGLTYRLELSDPGAGEDGWVDLASGRFDEDVRVGARDSAVLSIPVEFTYRGAGGVVRSLLDRGTFDYRVSGVVVLEKPFGTEVPYRRTGTVSLAGEG
ncbi:MAG: LEA type 2 family protein [Gemmatimonadetes bacterium]|nr:LEA type 2 family protein [Gemmatimonadota bacterium]